MKYQGLTYLFVTILIAGFFISCQKEEQYPIIPEIEFDHFVKLWDPPSMTYQRGVFVITFKDGDGDIGLRNDELDPPFDFNMFVNYYELQNGDTVLTPLVTYNQVTQTYDTSTFNTRIPILTPFGSNKSISGTIEDTLFMYNSRSSFDTIMFDTYIVDRELHKSNVVNTGWFLRN